MSYGGHNRDGNERRKGVKYMEFARWIKDKLFDFGAVFAIIVGTTIIIGFIFGLFANPINTLLGTAVWLAVLYYVFKRERSRLW